MRKNWIYRSVTAFCIAGFLASGSITAYATSGEVSGSVDMTGRDLTVNAGKDRDLFSSMKNLVPGDQVSNKVKITNNSSRAVTFYLKAYSDYVAEGDGAVRADGKSPETVTAEGKTFHEELLDMIHMEIFSGDELVYEGTAAGEGSLVTDDYGISLGSVPAGSEKALKVEITLPGAEMDNEFASTFAAIDWQFIAEGTSGGGGDNPGNNPGTGDGPGPGTIIETIVDQDVPLAGFIPGLDENVNILIEDEGVPLAGLAKTGGAVLYLKQVSIILVLLFIGLFLVNRQRKRALKKS